MRAALEEFAERGYAMASTNAITARAGISKGLLFHYFGSKKNLYVQVLREMVAREIERFRRAAPEPHPDIVERLLQISLYKQKLVREDPVATRFLATVLQAPEEIKPEVARLFREVEGFSARTRTEGMDTSRFRPGVDPAKAITLINVCVEGLRSVYAHRVTPGMADNPEAVEAIVQETREYLDMLKFGIYRRE
jgi:TetR/AcrR family transcriptional regulator